MRFSFALLFVSSAAMAGSPLGADRPYLQELAEKKQINVTDFDYPFLISQTAVLSPLAYNDAVTRIEAYFKKAATSLEGHGKDGKAPTPKMESLSFPKVAVADDQLDGIKTCNKEKCMIKLLTETEKVAVEKSTDKVKTYQQIVRDRVRSYLVDNKLKGYEDRPSNDAFVKKMLGIWGFFQGKYPEIYKHFTEGFWAHGAPPKSFQFSVVRQEMVMFGLSRLQPILRIGEVFAFQEGPAKVYFEMPIYSNHYFDSGSRILELIPDKGKTQVILTDIMELDELTKSGFIRMLFQDQMEGAVRRYQSEELKSIDGLVAA